MVNSSCQAFLEIVFFLFLLKFVFQVLLKRLGLQVTASICEKLARNYRHWRSGFPDLVLWNDQDAIFVEGKHLKTHSYLIHIEIFYKIVTNCSQGPWRHPLKQAKSLARLSFIHRSKG